MQWINLFQKKYLSVDKNFKISSIDKKLKSKRIYYPVIAKPINEGSSLGVEICKNKKSLIKSISKLVKEKIEDKLFIIRNVKM